MTLYELEAVRNNGETESLKKYEGKVVLVINSATGCGFTPQYEELEKLYEKYNDKGFEILDFPCNQFANQAKGTDAEIAQFCTLKYNTKFPLFKKIEVNGENTHPVFKFLKDSQPYKFSGKGKTKMAFISKLSKTSKSTSDIRWNFTKFLIDKNGNAIDRFEPVESIESIEKRIEELL
ncbi:MAG: glutathione peroxidase [Acholeplasmatales bacterium]|nr:glutathione peroxidase [Acholeplasmatales bacterium]